MGAWINLSKLQKSRKSFENFLFDLSIETDEVVFINNLSTYNRC